MGDLIIREPGKAAEGTYDLVVVGGGIYGACLALESSQRGLRTVLLEQDDFGGGASWNTLRILHGGFRYLQKLDLARFRESVAERRWFFRNFPELVRPLPCVMPLYGDGLRRPSAFGGALLLNALLSAWRNQGVSPEVALGTGRVLGVEEVVRLFPGVERGGLKGGGLWYDGLAVSTERLLIEILRWACSRGAVALNYVSAERLLTRAGSVQGVEAVDRESGKTLTFLAPAVVNCAGPWCRETARKFDRDIPDLFHRSAAFNLLLDRPPPSPTALAATARRPGARTHFLVPWKGMTLAGTHHSPLAEGETERPDRHTVERFLADLNEAVPGLDAEKGHIVRVHAGLLPTVAEGSEDIADREVIEDHGSRGGPRGLFSVSGVKFTTARLVAAKTLRRAFPGSARDGRDPPPGRAEAAPDRSSLHDSLGAMAAGTDRWAERLRCTVREESVLHLDDLILRRCDWTRGAEQVSAVLDVVQDELGWDGIRAGRERARLMEALPSLIGGASWRAEEPQGERDRSGE